MKRAVLYTRVSTFDQSPETQALDLRRLAEQRGFEIVQRAAYCFKSSSSIRSLCIGSGRG
jgi:DNA invertase Pin-like site-specific DNA recombinase